MSESSRKRGPTHLVRTVPRDQGSSAISADWWTPDSNSQPSTPIRRGGTKTPPRALLIEQVTPDRSWSCSVAKNCRDPSGLFSGIKWNAGFFEGQSTMNPFLANDAVAAHAAELLNGLTMERREEILLDVLTLRSRFFEKEFVIIGPVRAAFASYWETATGTPIPLQLIREVMSREVALLHESVAKYSEVDVPTLADLFAVIVGVVRPQVEAWQSYVQQMRRLSCPGCGDDGCSF